MILSEEQIFDGCRSQLSSSLELITQNTQKLEKILRHDAITLKYVYEILFEAAKANNELHCLSFLQQHNANGYIANFDTVDVAQLVSQKTDEVSPFIQASKVQFESHCASDCYWTADEKLIATLLENLLLHAVSITDNWIKLSVVTEESHLKIVCQQNGLLYQTDSIESVGSTLNSRFINSILALHGGVNSAPHFSFGSHDSVGELQICIP